MILCCSNESIRDATALCDSKLLLVFSKGERLLSLEMDMSLQRKERWNGPTSGSPGASMNLGLMSEKHPVPAPLAMAKIKLWELLAA